MSADSFVTVLVLVLLLAHVVVLLWLRGRIGWAIALNLIVSGGVVAYWLPDIAELPGFVPIVTAFIVFEALVLATSVAAAFRIGVPRAVIWTGFGAHLLLACAAAVFMLTFKMTRLF